MQLTHLGWHMFMAHSRICLAQADRCQLSAGKAAIFMFRKSVFVSSSSCADIAAPIVKHSFGISG